MKKPSISASRREIEFVVQECESEEGVESHEENRPGQQRRRRHVEGIGRRHEEAFGF